MPGKPNHNLNNDNNSDKPPKIGKIPPTKSNPNSIKSVDPDEDPLEEETTIWPPGFYCFKPGQTVSHLVAKQMVVFDTPVKDCRTKDNITCNIDVVIVFSIKRARPFVYDLGPEKFDGLLR